MSAYLWLIPLFPLAGAAINGLVGKRAPKRMVSLVACGTVLASLLVAAGAVGDLHSRAPEDRLIIQSLFTWIAVGDFIANAEFLLDPLSAVMILVVTGVGFLIHIYSIGYMRGEDGYYRFFAYLNLFMFSMLVLVLASNFLMMFVGWEGVGLCSYLLIGYYFDRKSAADAGKKAFIVNRIGDAGFILGILLIFVTFESLEFVKVFQQVAERFAIETSLGVLTAIALLLFMGATGKSAQVPLYVWLPDAMEGPTPVSALIHAATMVTAGVYIVVRCAPIFSRAPLALDVVTFVGIVTAVMAASIGLVQRDIKRVLAYSTVSQLGYMFVAAGVGAFSAGIFHLMTHSFFKALLFLAAGSVIHALGGEQDLTRMGGLRKSVPITHWTMLIAALAISGIPPFSGFFSKDEILGSAFSHNRHIVWGVGLVTAALTAFYMFRLYFLVFHGPERMPEEAKHHLHESPPSMRIPLVALAVFSLIAGWVALPTWWGVIGLRGSNWLEHYLEPVFRLSNVHNRVISPHLLGGEIFSTALSILSATLGIVFATYIYIWSPGMADRLVGRAKALYRLLYHKYYVDEIYDALFVNPTVSGSNQILWRGIDVRVIDGAVNGVGSAMQGWAGLLKNIQNGLVRTYASWILIGAVAILFYVFLISV